MPSLMRQLKNPMTENYLGLKKQIFDYRFPWYWQEGVTEPLPTGLRVINGTVEEYLDTYFNPPFYSHQILGRPWMGPGSKIFPYGDSPYIHLADDVLKEIFQYNDIDVDTVFRINVNCVRDEPNEKQLTFPHVDHPFPHSNMLIFLSDVGGKSIVQRSYGNDIVELNINGDIPVDDIIETNEYNIADVDEDDHGEYVRVQLTNDLHK